MVRRMARAITLRLGWVVLVALGGVASQSSVHLLHLVGVACCLWAVFVAPGLFGDWTKETWNRVRTKWPRATSRFPELLILFITIIPVWRCFIGDAPMSHDHPTHLARAWHFWNLQLGAGDVFGWSDYWFNGWPAAEDYPLGGNIWVCLFYGLSFGQLGWIASYGLSIGVMRIAIVAGHYIFCRVYCGRAIALVVAALAALEQGGGNEGGFDYTFVWGVWPFGLAMALVLLTFAAMDRLLKRGHGVDYLLTSFGAAASIIMHPFSVLLFAVALPMYAMARALGTDEPAGRIVARIVSTVGLGGALSAFWLIPFVVKGGDWFEAYGDLFRTTLATAEAVWAGTFLFGVPALIVALGVMGAALAVYQRRWFLVFMTCLASLFLYMSSRGFVEDLDLGAYASPALRIPFQRMLYYVKLAIFVLSATVLVEAFVKARQKLWEEQSKVKKGRTPGMLLLVAIVLAPLVVPFYGAYQHYAIAGELSWHSETARLHHYDVMGRWFRAQRERHPRYFRVAFVDGHEDHYMKLTLPYTQLPTLHTGFTPATTFAFRHERIDPETFRLLSIRYVVTYGSVQRPDLRLVRQFGQHYIYRFTGYTPKRYTLFGEGAVRVERFDPQNEHIRMQVVDPARDATLVLHVAAYANWRAYRNGEQIPIRPVQIFGNRGFISVPAGQAGEYRFEYGPHWTNTTGVVVALVALVLWLLIAFAAWRPSWMQPLHMRFVPWWQRFERYGMVVAVLLAMGGLSALGYKVLAQKPMQERSFLDQLERAEVTVKIGPLDRECTRTSPKHFTCSDAEWNYVGLKYQWFRRQGSMMMTDGRIRRCIWAHPIGGADLRIRFLDTELGQSIVGNQALMNRPGGSMSMTLYADGEEMGRTQPGPFNYFWDEFRFDTRSRAGQRVTLDFVVRSQIQGPWHYCFDAHVER